MVDMTVTGRYRFLEEGNVVAEFDNVLTTAGKREILGMIAGTSTRITRLGLGVGDATPDAADKTLFMPLVDTPVDFSVPLFGGASSKIVFKSRLDETVAGVIYEIGCYNSPEINEPLIFNFGDGLTDFAGPAGGGVNDVRIGPTSPKIVDTTPLVVDKVASAGDLRSTDTIALACKPSTTAASVLTVVIRDVNNNTATCAYTLPGGTTNYQVVNKAVSDFAFAGPFSWNDISRVTVTRDATANDIIMDGLSARSPLQAGILLSHAKYSAGVVKRFGVRMDVEYELTFNLG
jgi:hypothetical protein